MDLMAVEIVGTIGGTMIALSLLPQTVHTYQTKSAGDISLLYQGIYIFGTSLVNIYAIILGLWPVYIPCLIEESLIISLTVMKLLYDRNDRRDTELNTTPVLVNWTVRRGSRMRQLDLGKSWHARSARSMRRNSSTGSMASLDSTNAATTHKNVGSNHHQHEQQLPQVHKMMSSKEHKSNKSKVEGGGDENNVVGDQMGGNMVANK
ncbi:hypothetical protein ACHAXR_000870, partial [Thalassiosira sp. AJA248-18]